MICTQVKTLKTHACLELGVHAITGNGALWRRHDTCSTFIDCAHAVVLDLLNHLQSVHLHCRPPGWAAVRCW